MTNTSPRSISIMAGGGKLPIELAKSLQKRGRKVHMIALPGEHDPALADFETTHVKWGEVSKILTSLRSAGSSELVMAGTVVRPDLTAVHPDLGFFRAIPTIMKLVRAGGDDAVLRGVVNYFEAKGIKILGPRQVAPELFIGKGSLNNNNAPSHVTDDISLGFKIIDTLAPYDVGQSVVVANGHVEAIEGVEGTDAMLAQIYEMRRHQRSRLAGSASGVLIKRPKPGQELRVDLPVIGPRTVLGCAEANLEGIAVEAERVIAVARDELRRIANRHNLFVVGVDDHVTQMESVDAPVNSSGVSIKVVGRRSAGRTELSDIRKGTQLMAALEKYNTGHRLIVCRGHVLGIETDDVLNALLPRAKNLRQWGASTWMGRSGVAVLSAPHFADRDAIKEAAQAGLAGIAVCLRRFSAPLRKDTIRFANKNRLFIAEVNLTMSRTQGGRA